MLMGSHTSSPNPLKIRTSSAAVVYNKSFYPTLKDTKKEDITKEPEHRSHDKYQVSWSLECSPLHTRPNRK
jgi:hypothetical protein